VKIDLCALTEDLLPLYAEDLLSPATRQLLEQHGEACPACRQRLQEAKAAEPTPVPRDLPRLERPARAFLRRTRRALYALLVGTLVLLVAGSGLSYVLGRRSAGEREMIPPQVAPAEDVARRAVPGWDRAVAHGLVVDVGITERIPGTEATLTIEKAWYSGRQVYLLYTVTAPEGGHWIPTAAYLQGDDPERPSIGGQTRWRHLATWGGFSPEGFHSVLVFGRMPPVHDASSLELVVFQWGRVTPESGLLRSGSSVKNLRVLLPWDAAYLTEPEPEVIPWPQQHTWLGRTLALEALEVGIGQVTLTGVITLPEGERDPIAYASLVVGGQELDGIWRKAEPTGEPGQYRFAMTFDGPDWWPAEVELTLHGIEFTTDQVLEWPVNWARYRAASEDRLMDPEDQVTVRFYDSELTSIYTTDSGVAIEQRDPNRPAPYVRAAVRMGGRGFPPDLRPGFEVENEAGEVMTSLGGGEGVIYDGPGRNDERYGVAVMWWDELPESFRRSDRLIIRYVHPSAVLVLDETWKLPAAN